ncbi:hypothetical protein H5410_064200 [Solanum commersonii]|uniref:DNA-directed RNA polymerase n=1 Tax=Solanum commersonii TaxID=4109 RepID=A0A9J5W0A1_SOLCO|nr:hypothetical protein H5410_064200 [Solanum commersonii]
MNLKEIVLRSNLYGTCDAPICVKGPAINQLIFAGLQIERNRGYLIKTPHNFQDGSYPIDVVFMPAQTLNHSIHSYGNENEKQEILLSKYGQMEEDNLYLQTINTRLYPLYLHDKLAKLIKTKKIALKSILLTNRNCLPDL